MFKIGKGTDMGNVRTGDKTCEMRGFGIATEEGRTRQSWPDSRPSSQYCNAPYEKTQEKRRKEEQIWEM